MMDPETPQAPAESPEGRTIRPRTPEERAEAVEVAFDYRGDVTIELGSGEKVEGYVYNRRTEGASSLDVYLANGGGSVTIAYQDLAAITFSGEDTAFGKSWHDWMAKQDSQRRAEAQRVEDEARARGLL